MSNLTDFLDSMMCVLNNPGEKDMTGVGARFRIEDGIDSVDGKSINKIDQTITDDMTPEEKKIAKREYLRNYMREYKKTYVQPEHNKSHETKKRRKYRTALITSARIRKNADKLGIVIKNSYKIKINKGETDETKDQVRKSSSGNNI